MSMSSSSLTPVPDLDTHAPAASTSGAIAGPSFRPARSVQEIETDLSGAEVKLHMAYCRLGAPHQRNTRAPTNEEIRTSSLTSERETRRSAMAQVRYTDASTGRTKVWQLIATTGAQVADLRTTVQAAKVHHDLKNELETAKDQPARAPFKPFKLVTQPSASLFRLPRELKDHILSYVGPKYDHFDKYGRPSKTSREPTVLALGLTSKASFNMFLPDLLSRGTFQRFKGISKPKMASLEGLPPELHNHILQFTGSREPRLDEDGLNVEEARASAAKALALTSRAAYNNVHPERFANHLLWRAKRIWMDREGLDSRLADFKDIVEKAKPNVVDLAGRISILNTLGSKIHYLPREHSFAALNILHTQVRELNSSYIGAIYANVTSEFFGLENVDRKREVFNHICTLASDLNGTGKSAIYSSMAENLSEWPTEQSMSATFNQLFTQACELDGNDRAPALAALAGNITELNSPAFKLTCFRKILDEARNLRGTGQAKILARLPLLDLGVGPHQAALISEILSLSRELHGADRYSVLRYFVQRCSLADATGRHNAYEKILEQTAELESHEQRAEIMHIIVTSIPSLSNELQSSIITSCCAHASVLGDDWRANTLADMIGVMAAVPDLNRNAIFDAAMTQASEMNGEPRTLLLRRLASNLAALPIQVRFAAFGEVHQQALSLDEAARAGVFEMLLQSIPELPGEHQGAAQTLFQ